MSGCGIGAEGGAEVGTVEGEKGSWRKITSESLQALAEPSISVGYSLSVFLCVFSCLSHLHNLVSLCVLSLNQFLCFFVSQND